MEKQKYVLKATKNGHVIYNNTFDSREDYEIARKALEELNAMNVNDNSAESFEIVASEDKKENISEGAINFSKDNSKYPTLIFDPDDLIEDYPDEYDIEDANDEIWNVYAEIKERFQLGSNYEEENVKNYAHINDIEFYLGIPNTSSELACIEVKAGYYDGFQLSIATPRLEDLTSDIRDGYTSYDEEMPDADIKNMLDEAEKNAVEFLKKLHLEYPCSKFLHKAGWVPSYSDKFEEACDSKTSGKMLKEEHGPWYDYSDGSMICKDIADYLENGNTFGSLSDSQGSHLTNWKATINGKDVEDVVSSTAVIDWVLRELSFPVADGHIYYRDLNLIFNNYSYLDDIDIYNEQVQQDLIALGFDEDKVKEMAEKDIPEDGSTDNPNLEEIECWIDYDIEFYNGCDSMDDVVEKYKESMDIDEAKEMSDDEYEFRVVRKNALANPSLYGGRYTQKNIRDARKEYLADKEAKIVKDECSKSLNEATLMDIVHPVRAVSIDAIDRIIKKYGYELTDVIDISEQDGKHEYNCMLDISPDYEHYGKKNLDKDANILEKTLKNKLETNNIKVKHPHDSNGLNVYFYYSESLDDETLIEKSPIKKFLVNIMSHDDSGKVLNLAVDNRKFDDIESAKRYATRKLERYADKNHIATIYELNNNGGIGDAVMQIYFEDGKVGYERLDESVDDVLKVTVKDWYKETYPTDDLGDEISDTVTFEEIAKQPNRVYELLNVNDSLVRERVFQEISSRGKLPYDDIYKNWLGESKQIDSMKLLKKNLQKINESFDSMNVSEKTSEKKTEVKAKEDTKVFSDKNDTYSIKVKKNNKQEIEEALKILDNAFDKKD